MTDYDRRKAVKQVAEMSEENFALGRELNTLRMAIRQWWHADDGTAAKDEARRRVLMLAGVTPGAEVEVSHG